MSNHAWSSTEAAGRVSVVIPTRDRWPLLAEALESLRQQTYPHWEALVVDDGSGDGTLERLQALSAEEPRLRPQVRRERPPGANACRNLGLAAARGEYLLFLDSDDMLSPRCLEERVRLMQAHPELDFGVFPHQHFQQRPGDMSRVVPAVPGQDDLERYLRVDVPWQTAGPLWRRSALERLGPWDERLPCWQDWDYYVRALAHGVRYQCFPNGPLFFHRVQGGAWPTISGKPRGPAELLAIELALASAQHALEGHGALTSHRRSLLAQLHLSLAEQWRALGHLRQAAEVWSRCRERGLVGPPQHLQGRLLLCVHPFRLLRGTVRRLLSWQWAG